ncbi:Uncharacterised protein [Mycobacteroides abscessus]|nr:Uncharacterised protein [Mycobacteroides abscessus]
MRRTPSSLFFTFFMKVSTSYSAPAILSSMVSTDSFAPPCSGPESALTPAATDA